MLAVDASIARVAVLGGTAAAGVVEVSARRGCGGGGGGCEPSLVEASAWPEGSFCSVTISMSL